MVASMTHPIEPPAAAREVRERHRFDEEKLLAWWKDAVRPQTEALTVRQFKGGQSNPTFWIHDGDRAWVLRKKPPGELLPSAHAVEREHRIMSALADTDVPVPEVSALCEDPEVIGTPFFVMAYVEGRIFWNVQLPGVEPAERTAIYEELARVLAALHQVDHREVGLGDYGKGGQYVARQVARWTKQYQASRTGDVPAMEALIRFLPEHLPASDVTTLVHGDYRMDNLIFHPTEPRCLAVLDWELSTLGHPLADAAYTCMLYDVALPNVGGLLGVDFAATGIPPEDEFLARYVAHGGHEPPGGAAEWAYFKAFSLFRLAAIAQGVYKRSLQGNASSDQASMFGAAVGHLAGIACRLVGVSP